VALATTLAAAITAETTRAATTLAAITPAWPPAATTLAGIRNTSPTSTSVARWSIALWWSEAALG
jgi:hypothetical protein